MSEKPGKYRFSIGWQGATTTTIMLMAMDIMMNVAMLLCFLYTHLYWMLLAFKIYIAVFSALKMIVTITWVPAVFRPTSKAIRVGIIVDKMTGERSVSLDKYDEFVTIYDNRHSNPLFWLTVLNLLILVAVAMAANMMWVLVVLVIEIIVTEIVKYRMRNLIEKKKTTWGAAALLHELQQFLK